MSVIDTEDQLETFVKDLSTQTNLYYRGVCEARYKQYTSAQRYWTQNYLIREHSGASNYCNFIDYLIKLVDNNIKIQNVLKQHKIPVNDFLLLALLQHYGKPSPLLDLSRDVYTSLFFAFDGYKDKAKDDKNELSDYVSLYVIKNNTPEVSNSLQKIYETAAIQACQSLEDEKKIHSEASNEMKIDFERLPFLNLYNADVPYIVVDAGEIGVTEANIPRLGMKNKYDIRFPRVAAQNGLFILNNSGSTPLEDVAKNSVNSFVIYCYHIKKSLFHKAETMYLNHGKEKETLYQNSSYDSNNMQNLFDALIPNLLLKKISLSK